MDSGRQLTIVGGRASRGYQAPNVLHNYLERTLGQGYHTSTNDIGCRSQVQIFRSGPSSGGEDDGGTSIGLVLKQPRDISSSRREVDLELQNLFKLAPIFPLPNGNVNEQLPKEMHIPRVADGAPPGFLITQSLPGVNAATAFHSTSSVSRIELVSSVAKALRQLHASSVPTETVHNMYYDSLGISETTSGHTESTEYSDTHHWFRQLVHHFLELLDRRKAEDQAASRGPFQLPEEPRAHIAILESYANLPPNDPYWKDPRKGKMALLHGDYMLPNIIIETHSPTDLETVFAVTGLVDLGDIGMGDTRYDVWAAYSSIRMNAKMSKLSCIETESLASTFLEEYYSGTLSFGADFAPWQALYEVKDYISENLQQRNQAT